MIKCWTEQKSLSGQSVSYLNTQYYSLLFTKQMKKRFFFVYQHTRIRMTTSSPNWLSDCEMSFIGALIQCLLSPGKGERPSRYALPDFLCPWRVPLSPLLHFNHNFPSSSSVLASFLPASTVCSYAGITVTSLKQGRRWIWSITRHLFSALVPVELDLITHTGFSDLFWLLFMVSELWVTFQSWLWQRCLSEVHTNCLSLSTTCRLGPAQRSFGKWPSLSPPRESSSQTQRPMTSSRTFPFTGKTKITQPVLFYMIIKKSQCGAN